MAYPHTYMSSIIKLWEYKQGPFSHIVLYIAGANLMMPMLVPVLSAGASDDWSGLPISGHYQSVYITIILYKLKTKGCL